MSSSKNNLHINIFKQFNILFSTLRNIWISYICSNVPTKFCNSNLLSRLLFWKLSLKVANVKDSVLASTTSPIFLVRVQRCGSARPSPCPHPQLSVPSPAHISKLLSAQPGSVAQRASGDIYRPSSAIKQRSRCMCPCPGHHQASRALSSHHPIFTLPPSQGATAQRKPADPSRLETLLAAGRGAQPGLQTLPRLFQQFSKRLLCEPQTTGY